MKQVKDLSIDDVEKLCLLYNECQLSVQEETELEYILLCTAFSSDIINETRVLMGVSRQMKFPNVSTHSKNIFYGNVVGWTLCKVACVLMVLIGSFVLLKRHRIMISTNGNYYVAYVEGKQVNEEDARIMAEKEAAKVAEFMQLIEEQKIAEQNKVRQFINYQNNKR